VRFEATTDTPDAEEILATALARNPTLRMLEADVRRAQALLDLARTSGVPDFTLGLEVDVKASPVIVEPSASMTLPIWRDKIAAEIAAAHAGTRAAQARLSAEQVQVAADLASLLFMYRESQRNTLLLAQRLLPKARQSLDAARGGYITARSSFLDVIDAERQLLGFELGHVEARTQRELALAGLSLTIAGVPPAGAPVLEGRAEETAP
jgi:outer membrane protein TolC